MKESKTDLRKLVSWCLAMTLLLAVWGTSGILMGDPQTGGEGKTAAQEPKTVAADAEKPQPSKPAVATTDPIEIIRQGGFVMYPLLACSVIVMALFFERLVSLRRARVIPKPFVKRFLEQVRDGDLDRERALELCRENRSPIAEVFAGAVRKWGRPSVEVEQGIIDAGERVTNGLRKYLRVFSALTVIAPLLGLLGTVIGMINIFNVVAGTSSSRGDPNLLAGGISRALLNTAFGLIVAIPAQSLYYFFVSRVDRLIIDMDLRGQELADLISAEEIQNRNEGPKTRSRRPARREAEAET